MKNDSYGKELLEIIENYNFDIDGILKMPIIIRTEDIGDNIYSSFIRIKKVIYVNTKKDSKKIVEMFSDVVSKYNIDRKKISSKYKIPFKPYKPKIKTIYANNQNIVLSKTPAHRSVKLCKKDIVYFVECKYSILKKNNKDSFNANLIENEYNMFNEWADSNLNNNDIYTVHLDSGKAYRISYYDDTKNKRNQVSIGNYLIISGSNNSIVDSNKKKIRSDILKEMYRIYDISIMDK